MEENFFLKKEVNEEKKLENLKKKKIDNEKLKIIKNEKFEIIEKKREKIFLITKEDFEIKKENEISFDNISELEIEKNYDSEGEKIIDLIMEKNEKKYHYLLNKKFFSPNNSYSENSTVDSFTQYEKIENSVSKENFSLINNSFYLRKFYWFLNNNKCFKEKKKNDNSTQCDFVINNNLFFSNEFFTIYSKEKIKEKEINYLKINLSSKCNLYNILQKLIYKKEKGILLNFLYKYRRKVKSIKIMEKAEIIKSFFSKIKYYNKNKLNERKKNILRYLILKREEKKIILHTYFKIFRRNIKQIELNINADIIKNFCKEKLKKFRLKNIWKDYSYLQNKKREIIKKILTNIIQKLISNNLIKEKEIKENKFHYIINKYFKRNDDVQILRSYFFKFRRIVKQINIYENGEKIRKYLRKKLYYTLYKKKWKEITKKYIKYNKMLLIKKINKK